MNNEIHPCISILSRGFAVMYPLSVTVYPVMAADAAKTQLDTFNTSDIPALPVRAGENNPVNVTVSNTTEISGSEDRAGVPGTGAGIFTKTCPVLK